MWALSAVRSRAPAAALGVWALLGEALGASRHHSRPTQQLVSLRGLAGAAPPAAPAAAPAPAHSLRGVVEQLRDERRGDAAATAASAAARRQLWEVLEFRPNGVVLETLKSPETLGLAPRDSHLLASHGSLGGQRALLQPRPGAGLVLFRTEVAKAVVYADRAVLFPARRLRETVRLAQAVKSASRSREHVPFELRVLEALLAETCHSLAGKARRLAMVAGAVLADVTRAFHATAQGAELQRLAPVSRRIAELQADVGETLEALAAVADDDAAVRALCLSEGADALRRGRAGGGAGDAGDARPADGDGGGGAAPPPPRRPPGRGAAAALAPAPAAPPAARSPEMHQAASVLEWAEFQLAQTAADLRELVDNVDTTKSVWHMQLDSQRNRVLRVNLLISIASFGVVSAAFVPAVFGMNLASGLEAAPSVFWQVAAGSSAAGAAVALACYGYFRFGPKRRYEKRMRDVKSLQDLLFLHIDEVEDALGEVQARAAAGAAPRKRDFEAALRRASASPVSPEEGELLWRVWSLHRGDFEAEAARARAGEAAWLEQQSAAGRAADPLGHHLS